MYPSSAGEQIKYIYYFRKHIEACFNIRTFYRRLFLKRMTVNNVVSCVTQTQKAKAKLHGRDWLFKPLTRRPQRLG